MVQTRHAKLREQQLQENSNKHEGSVNSAPADIPKRETDAKHEEKQPFDATLFQLPKLKGTSNVSSKKTQKSCSSSTEARRKKLELEAAKKIAEIEKTLIDKQLQADLAELEADSSKSKSRNDGKSVSCESSEKVQQWLQQSHAEMEKLTYEVPPSAQATAASTEYAHLSSFAASSTAAPPQLIPATAGHLARAHQQWVPAAPAHLEGKYHEVPAASSHLEGARLQSSAAPPHVDRVQTPSIPAHLDGARQQQLPGTAPAPPHPVIAAHRSGVYYPPQPTCTRAHYYNEAPAPAGYYAAPPRPETEQLDDNAQFRSVRKDNQELLTRLATSKDLPLYFGDPMEWLQFKQAFYESTKMCKYSQVENVWRLRKCLRGEAKEAVASLLIGDTSPEVIIQTLELCFGRPENIIQKIVTQVKKMSPLPASYHNDIVNFAIKIKNCVTAARAINEQDYLRSPDMLSLVISKLPNALINRWADYYSIHRFSTNSKLELLSDLLMEEATKTATVGISHIHSQSENYKKKYEDTRRVTSSSSHTVLVNTDSDKCKVCNHGYHKLIDCTRFKRAMRRDRWRIVRKFKLCGKCLEDGHMKDTCQADVCDIDSCGMPHHKLLHWPNKRLNTNVIKKTDDISVEPETVTNTIIASDYKVLLKVVPVTVHGPRGSVATHALLDDGATVSLCSSNLAARAGLHGHAETMRVRGAWDSGELLCTSEIVNFSISNCYGDKFDIRARKMNELDLPVQKCSSLDIGKYTYLNLVKDFVTLSDVKPQLLLGQDNYHLLMPLETISGLKNEPYATRTRLGWSVHGVSRRAWRPDLDTHGEHGRAPPAAACAALISPPGQEKVLFAATTSTCENSQPFAANVLFLDVQRDADSQLHEEVRRSFALEAIGVNTKPRENQNDLRAIHILDQTSELKNGRWEVGLPWKHGDKMPNSYPNAHRRLLAIERKMQANEEYARKYTDRIEHLLDNDYARELCDDEVASGRVWYLPHFGVDNPNKKNLRLVFDAAATSGGGGQGVPGYSLNDYLLQGPDLLESLLGIMLRFREKKIGIIGDIKDMFLRIKIRNEDQHALRFLWRENVDQPTSQNKIKKYAMTSLIFGANCSPFIAQHIKNKNAIRFQDKMPQAVEAILKSHYMDDYIDSLDDEDLTIKIIKDITYIHKEGGFEIRNWTCNKPNVLQSMPKETLSTNTISFKMGCEDISERTLGLLWFPANDTLGFDLSLKRIPTDILKFITKPTKRETLRITMSIFDVFGLLAPITIKAKIVIQKTWKENIKWDSQISDELFVCFRDWLTQLQCVKEIRIPRWYFHSAERARTAAAPCVDKTAAAPGEITRECVTELHIFCDASPSAFAAVGYWRQVCDKNIYVSFIACKSRVAPLKSTSIPRIELQGCILGCRLASVIEKEHRLKANARYFWTDSTVVLNWIRNDTRNYKVFVGNRLGEIDMSSKITEWHYVPTNLNIADIATKCNNYKLNRECEWFNGPSFLYKNRDEWPREPEKQIKNIIEDDTEIVHAVNSIEDTHLPVPDPSRFSSWLRLLRCTATVLLFVERCRKNYHRKIDTEFMKKAETMLLRHAQSQSFKAEISSLQRASQIDRNSRLRTLTPYLDTEGVLRVGGRIDAVKNIEINVKYPAILDGQEHIARLIVKHYHEKTAHSNNELVVNELRQKYWLLRLRPTVRTVASKCLPCRIRKANPRPPRMGDLPAARLHHHQRPFTNCGVDLFGPLYVTVGRRKEKRYGVLFTCMTVRAIHVETVTDLTTDSLIMALRRMAARRGWPERIYSDNGTNLRGADTELKKAFAELDQVSLHRESTNRGVDWRFICPVCPNQGGAWERMIRSVKTALHVVLKERAPRHEVLMTLLAEVESMVNSRPLTHVSVEPHSEEALTPNHFLLGSSSGLPVPGVFDNKDLILRRQWRIAQRLTDLFWQRWTKEVLPALIPRQKWTQDERPLKTGDLVLIVDPNLPRNTWPRGIIQKVYPGKDGRVRVIDIKTKIGVLRRPVTRAALLPTKDDECREVGTGAEIVEDASPARNC